MSNLLKDVLRVEGTETGTYTSIRERQTGYTVDGSEPKKIIHKYAGGSYGVWVDEDGVQELINTGVNNLTVADEDVSTYFSDYPTLITQEMVNNYLLGPDLDIIYFNDNQANVEKGDSIASVSLDWGLTGSISSITLTDAIGGSTGMATGYSGALTINYSPNLGDTGVYTYTLSATDLGGTEVSDTETFFFGLYTYWGQSANDYSTITEGIIEAASNGGSTLERDTSSSKSKSEFSQAGGGKYIYYAYPAAWGTLSTIKVNGFGSTWNHGTVSVTNAQGNTENYYAYVSPNVINGTVTLEFS